MGAAIFLPKSRKDKLQNTRLSSGLLRVSSSTRLQYKNEISNPILDRRHLKMQFLENFLL